MFSTDENKSDDEFCVDNLSDYSCDSDTERLLIAQAASGESESSDSDEFPIRPRRRPQFPQQLISSDSDSESSADENEEWRSVDRPPVLEQFLGSPGLNPQYTVNNIIDAVELFIGDELMEFMVEESNRYHAQNAAQFKEQKKSLKWKDVNLIQMRKFLGLIILMGQTRKDRRDEFWSTDPLLEVPIFSKTMSRDRFRQIWKSWHFSNNEDIPPQDQNPDKLCKVRPVLDLLLPKFIDLYKPRQQISLDEAIIPWRGRLSFRVYNAGKIIKYGILVRMACEATTGYVCNFEIYCSQGKKLLETVETVLTPYFGLWHHVFMDNFYNSVSKSEVLLSYKIKSCGTIRENRGFPDSLKNLKLNKGEMMFRRKKDVLLQVWRSKRDVRMISTIHSAEMLESQNMYWHSKERIVKPNSIIEYNKYMKGVD